jgi:hypothetical protein
VDPPLVASADPVRTRHLMDHLIAAFEQYCNEAAAELPFIDAFMGVHNFHKAIVLDLAERQGLTGTARALFLQMAIVTFADGLRTKGEPDD